MRLLRLTILSDNEVIDFSTDDVDVKENGLYPLVREINEKSMIRRGGSDIDTSVIRREL